MSNRKFNIADWNANHFKKVEEVAHKVKVIYYTAVKEATQIALSANPDPAQEFTFDAYPKTRERINDLLQKLALHLVVTIQAGQKAEWTLANAKNDALVGYVLGKTALSRASVSRYSNQNLEALAAFQQRKIQGLGVSDRVWKYTTQFRREMELGLDLGIGEGKSAVQIARSMQQYLVEPDNLFRRVRNKRANLVLSKNAELFHPGTGVYRSSYKNALRLSRTEINAAYHSADRARWSQLDFVVGYEVRRSNNKTACEVCDSLKGFYPKSFVWNSWHPSCRCNAIPILATAEELSQLNRLLLTDQDTSAFRSSKEITQINPGFMEWLDRNQERLSRAKSLPSFITDNLALGV